MELFLEKKIRTTIIFDTGKLFKIEEKTYKNMCSSGVYSFLFLNS